jgi:hypothetical protein
MKAGLNPAYPAFSFAMGKIFWPTIGPARACERLVPKIGKSDVRLILPELFQYSCNDITRAFAK